VDNGTKSMYMEEIIIMLTKERLAEVDEIKVYAAEISESRTT